jgi:exonuclease III
MTQLAEWADQYRAEIEKQASARAAQLESLLIVGDYQACREFLDMWESDDSESGSLREKYRNKAANVAAVYQEPNKPQ